MAFLQFLVASNPNNPPQAMVPPPANSGPVSIVTTYPRAQAGALDALADQFGITGDQLHRVATMFVAYLYLIS